MKSSLFLKECNAIRQKERREISLPNTKECLFMAPGALCAPDFDMSAGITSMPYIVPGWSSTGLIHIV